MTSPQVLVIEYELELRSVIQEILEMKGFHVTNCETGEEGIGIPEQEIHSLFQPFHRATNSKGVKGTGLGLVIVRDHIKKHGGSISIQSKVDEGTTVSVNLPYNKQCEPLQVTLS